MTTNTDDLRIRRTNELVAPQQLISDIALDETAAQTVSAARRSIHDILAEKDDRLLVVVGPCSIHDPDAARDYAQRLQRVAQSLQADLQVVMRVYFEKPRTTVGWKGLVNDPYLDDSFKIEEGLHIGRKLLLDILEFGLPTATEALDPISPQYLQLSLIHI